MNAGYMKAFAQMLIPLTEDMTEINCPHIHQHPLQVTGSSLIFYGVEQPEAPLMLHYIWQLADHFSDSFRDT